MLYCMIYKYLEIVSVYIIPCRTDRVGNNPSDMSL